LRVKNYYIALFPVPIANKNLNIFNIKIIFFASNLIIQGKHMIKLKSNIWLYQVNNLLSIIRLGRTPKNNLEHIFQILEEMNKMPSEANINFKFFIIKDSIQSWKFIFKDTRLEKASIKRNNNSSFIDLFSIFFLLLL